MDQRTSKEQPLILIGEEGDEEEVLVISPPLKERIKSPTLETPFQTPPAINSIPESDVTINS